MDSTSNHKIQISKIDWNLANRSLIIVAIIEGSAILRPHSANIKSLILDPTRFGDDLVSANLIAQNVVDNLASQRGVSDYERASRMVSIISQAMSVSQQSASQIILLDLCKVLRKQESEVLNEIVDDIERQLGKPEWWHNVLVNVYGFFLCLYVYSHNYFYV